MFCKSLCLSKNAFTNNETLLDFCETTEEAAVWNVEVYRGGRTPSHVLQVTLPL